MSSQTPKTAPQIKKQSFLKELANIGLGGLSGMIAVSILFLIFFV